jgi:hypothetical protein
MAEQQQNPNLISRKAMSAMSNTSGARGETVHEIFTKINNAKDKPKKIEVLKRYDTPYIRQLLKAAFDPKIKWILPEGTPPYIANEAPEGTEHTLLRNETRKLYLFLEGGDNTISKTRKETLFIQMLEGLHKTEAEVLINVKDKKLNKVYKGLTEQLIKETFNWNDDFMKNTK